MVCFRKPGTKEEYEGITGLLRGVRSVVGAAGRVESSWDRDSERTTENEEKEEDGSQGKDGGDGEDGGKARDNEKDGDEGYDDGAGGYGGDWDGVCLAVAMERTTLPGYEVSAEEWEDMCFGLGFEFVDGEVKGSLSSSSKAKSSAVKRNEFGGKSFASYFSVFKNLFHSPVFTKVCLRYTTSSVVVSSSARVPIPLPGLSYSTISHALISYIGAHPPLVSPCQQHHLIN